MMKAGFYRSCTAGRKRTEEEKGKYKGRYCGGKNVAFGRDDVGFER